MSRMSIEMNPRLGSETSAQQVGVPNMMYPPGMQIASGIDNNSHMSGGFSGQGGIGRTTHLAKYMATG